MIRIQYLRFSIRQIGSINWYSRIQNTSLQLMMMFLYISLFRWNWRLSLVSFTWEACLAPTSLILPNCGRQTTPPSLLQPCHITALLSSFHTCVWTTGRVQWCGLKFRNLKFICDADLDPGSGAFWALGSSPGKDLPDPGFRIGPIFLRAYRQLFGLSVLRIWPRIPDPPDPRPRIPDPNLVSNKKQGGVINFYKSVEF